MSGEPGHRVVDWTWEAKAGEEYGEGRVMVPKSIEVADDSGCSSLVMRSVDMYARPVCVALESA